MLATSPLIARTLHSAVWTGSDVLIWGGIGGDGHALLDGAAYDPSRDSWRRIADAPGAAVGRGSQRAVVGGGGVYVAEIGDSFRLLRYDLADDGWEVLPAPPVGTDGLVSLAWANDRLVLLSFPEGGKRTPAMAASYHPATGTWDSLAPSPLSADATAPALWTGREVVSLSRPLRAAGLASGAALDLASSAWRPLRAFPDCTTEGAAWVDGFVLSATGIYSLDAEQCAPLPPPPEDPRRQGLGRESYSTVWTGQELIIWSGTTETLSFETPPDGAAYRVSIP